MMSPTARPTCQQLSLFIIFKSIFHYVLLQKTAKVKILHLISLNLNQMNHLTDRY